MLFFVQVSLDFCCVFGDGGVVTAGTVFPTLVCGGMAYDFGYIMVVQDIFIWESRSGVVIFAL